MPGERGATGTKAGREDRQAPPLNLSVEWNKSEQQTPLPSTKPCDQSPGK